MKFQFVILFVSFAIAMFTTTSCTSWRISRATAELQTVEGSQNDWGKIAVSDLNFVPNKGQFNINFNEDVTNYVQAARNNISGNASSSLQSALYVGVLAQGMFAPPISTGAPASSTNLPNQTSIPNQAQTVVNGFPQPPSLNSLNPTTDERDAVEKGINDKIAEFFLKFMANPDVNSNQEAIVFGVMQATCQPGVYTRKGYIAELDVYLKYGRIINGRIINGYTNNNEVEVETNPVPGVLAVLPLMESRNMQLQSSDQQQIELAMALSAAFSAKGMNAAANMLSDYVKRQQSNINTRNSLPVITTYTDGDNFGLQIYPSAQAIENPGKAGSSSGDILEPVTFPVVVAIKIDKDEEVKQEGNQNNPWNLLVTETQTRWIPIKWQFWPWVDQMFLSIGGRELGNDVPLYERMLRARKIDEARAELKLIDPTGEQYPNSIPPQYHYQYLQLQAAIDSLTASALSYEAADFLPDNLFSTNAPVLAGPTITDVYPHTIWRDTNTDFAIFVKDVLDPADVSSVIIDGKTCQPFNVTSYGTTNFNRFVSLCTSNSIITNSLVGGKMQTTNLVSISTNSDSGVITNFVPQGIVITATLPESFYSITNSATNNVDFVVLLKHEAPAAKTIGMMLQGRTAPEAAATIVRDSNGKLLGVNIKPGQVVTEQELLDALKVILQKSESPPKTTTVVP